MHDLIIGFACVYSSLDLFKHLKYFLAHLAKGNVSFYHHLVSVVRLLSSVNFSHCNLLL